MLKIKKYLKVGDKLIPVAEPSPDKIKEVDPKGLAKLRDIKSGFKSKTRMFSAEERNDIQEDVAAVIRPSGSNEEEL